MTEALFWIALGAIAYTYVGFPLLVWLVGLLRPRPVNSSPCTPRISVVIAAYNEQECIGATLTRLLDNDYPTTQLEVIVASDGSTDRTEEIVAGFAGRGIRCLPLPRQGKIAALDSAIRETSGEILVMMDANTQLDRGALTALVRNFADPDVGGVCGDQRHLDVADAGATERGERLYWSYDRWLKRLEGRTGSIVSADGALYAIRRELYEKPHSAAVTDDFFISTAVIDRGRRLVFEPEARAFEPAPRKAAAEFARKVRIINAGLRGVMARRRLLNPLRFGFYAVVLLSHKVLRRVVPLTFPVLFVTSIMLAGFHPFYMTMALLQSAVVLLAILGYVWRRNPLGSRNILYIPFFFCMANLAALWAIVLLFRGERFVSWQPAR